MVQYLFTTINCSLSLYHSRVLSACCCSSNSLILVVETFVTAPNKTRLSIAWMFEANWLLNFWNLSRSFWVRWLTTVRVQVFSMISGYWLIESLIDDDDEMGLQLLLLLFTLSNLLLNHSKWMYGIGLDEWMWFLCNFLRERKSSDLLMCWCEQNCYQLQSCVKTQSMSNDFSIRNRLELQLKWNLFYLKFLNFFVGFFA